MATEYTNAPFGSAEELKTHSLSELLGRLTRELTTLVRQEVDLAKMELTERGRVAAAAGAFLASGAMLLFVGFIALTAAIILALAMVLPAWAAALIVACAYIGLGVVLALIGKQRMERAQPPAPQTLATIKENVEWAKMRARNGWK